VGLQQKTVVRHLCSGAVDGDENINVGVVVVVEAKPRPA